MSNVKLKNALAREIDRKSNLFPYGFATKVSLKDGKLCIEITSCPVDLYDHNTLKPTAHGYSIAISLMGKDGYSPEGERIVAQLKAIAASIVASGGPRYWVYISSDACLEQCARMRAAGVAIDT